MSQPPHDPSAPSPPPQDPSGDQPSGQPGFGYPPPYGSDSGQGSYPPPPPGPPSYGYGTPPGQPPYGYQQGYGAQPPSNQKALWSMVIGIVSLPLACYACLGWLGIAAIILGNNAKKEIAATHGQQQGAGQAQAGVILGWIAVVLGTLVLIANIALFATGNTTFDYNVGT